MSYHRSRAIARQVKASVLAAAEHMENKIVAQLTGKIEDELDAKIESIHEKIESEIDGHLTKTRSELGQVPSPLP